MNHEFSYRFFEGTKRLLERVQHQSCKQIRYMWSNQAGPLLRKVGEFISLTSAHSHHCHFNGYLRALQIHCGRVWRSMQAPPQAEGA